LAPFSLSFVQITSAKLYIYFKSTQANENSLFLCQSETKAHLHDGKWAAAYLILYFFSFIMYIGFDHLMGFPISNASAAWRCP